MKSQGLRRTKQLSITWVNSKLNLLNIEPNFSNLHLKEEKQDKDSRSAGSETPEFA